MRFAIRVVLLVLLILAFYLPQALAEPYGWPLNENFGISATFGEFRDDHFHAGLDLSTNGETGLPVLAIADGKVVRLKVQKRGYGRALYIQHPDGMTSVYAHLEGYSTELGLEHAYQQKAKEMGTRYVGDIFLNPPVEVKKGDVVAFSGESGAGLPHLHLELRRNETVAVNPLLNGFQDTLDPIPPTFQSCYFYPLTPDSAVDGDLETEEIRLRKEELYFVQDHTPVVRGDFMVSVAVYDAALRPYHRAPKKLVLSIDNRILYTLEFTEFSYAEPEGFGLVYDLGKPGASYYEYPILLSKIVKTTAQFAAYSAPFSTRSLSAGLHQLQIEATDANNNTSLAHIDLVVNNPPAMQIQNVSANDKDLIVTASVADSNWKATGIQSLAGEVEYSTDEGKSFLPFPATSLDLTGAGDSAHFSYRVPLVQLQAPATQRILIKARGFDGVEYSPYTVIAISPASPHQVLSPQKPPEGRVQLQTYSNAIKVIFDTEELLTYPLEVQVGTPPVTFSMEARDLASYQAIIPAPKINDNLILSLPGGQQVSIPIHYSQASIASHVESENYELTFAPNSFYWDTFVWTKSLPAYRARYLPLIGPMLQLGPRGVPLKKSVPITVHYPSDFEHPKKLSIYAWNRAAQKWKSLPSPVDQTSRTVQTNINVLDLYALIYDNVPPVITPIFPKRWSVTSNRTPKLAAEIRDIGMDVDDEKISFYVDGVGHVADYDPDRNLATLQIDQPLRKGYHQFWIVAYDYGGNKTVSSKVTFRVR